MFSRFFKWYFSKSALPYWCVLGIDCVIVFLSGLVAAYLRMGGDQFAGNFWQICYGMLLVVFFYGIGFRLFHTYSGIIRYSSFNDLANVAKAGIFGAAFSYMLSYGLEHTGALSGKVVMPYLSGHFIILFVSVLLMWVVRVIVKTVYDVVRIGANTDNAMIYGIKDGGAAIARYIRSADPVKYDLKGFIAPYESDDVPEVLQGVPVFKDDEELLAKILDKRIKVVLVSPRQQDNFPNREKLVEGLVNAGIKILMVKQDSEEWDGKSDFKQNQISEVDIEDLLPRDKIEVDLKAIGALLKDKTVMITGAAGSIGYEMARQVAKFAPKSLILIDQAETPMHAVRLHMKNHYPDLSCETIVSSITNKSKMEILFAEHCPDYIFHAAAYKHVPMMEDNPSEAVQNNVYGTRVIADLAVAYGTKKFVMISTDKAVNPTNVMGCSKRICEIYCQSLNRAVEKGEVKMADGNPALTQFITTRFGNVLGSNGSVIPIFRKQILSGGPVTVTHPDIIRFFMLIPEACRLVLEAGTMGHGGEIFVFDMGKPVRIADLAQKMIDLSGAKGVEIKFTGLRDGEKLFEEVLSDKENTKPTVHPKIMVASVREYDYALALKNEKELLEISYKYDDMETVRKMKEIVPEYKSQHSKYQVLD